MNLGIKRIGKAYFFVLKKKGIEILSKNTIISLKNKCLGINKRGLQCNHLIFDKYCFWHKKQITFIDLFSGAGGFSLGLKKSGLKHLYGIDSCAFACETYKKNVGFNICGDLCTLKPPKLKEEVDVLIGSPPCQSFSLANRRSTNNLEDRSLLYLSFLNYLQFYTPKIFVLENVIGLLSHKLKDGSKSINNMIQDFSVGYCVKIFKVCCSDFGVPQKRKRILIIGVRKDFGLFFPDLKKCPCSKVLRSLLLDEKNVPSNYFLSKKAISGILRRQAANFLKGNGFGAQYLNIDGFCNTITANY